MKISLTLAILFAASVAACSSSSKPEASDVEPLLKSSWADCPDLELVNLRKSNGIARDNGKYEMEITYQLRAKKDYSAGEAWYGQTPCKSQRMYALLASNAKRDGSYGKDLKAGATINVKDVYLMVKSENGWIKQ